MIRNRYLTETILEDLQEKMVFVGGPRQVGKTTFAVKIIGERIGKFAYFNWDNRSDRQAVMKSEWPGDASLIILDEIHKLRNWKRLVKGEYDKLKERYRFLVTGSARLDIYRRGGDSLQGRYHYYRLHPFSLAEMLGTAPRLDVFKDVPFGDGTHREEFEALFKYGGFPEPLFRADDRTLRRWHNEKIERMVREEIGEIEQVRDLGHLKLLSDMLPSRVGSLLSVNALREELEVSHRAVSNWLRIFESFYYAFSIHPYVKKGLRSIKKQPKLYLWDWSEVDDPSARFENLIAAHLLKACHYLNDRDGRKAELHFLRNFDGKEVDFLVTIDRKPWFAVEAKSSEKSVSPSLRYFQKRLKIPFAYQVIRESGFHRFSDGVHVISADRFLAGLV
jgi:uncharacterized protein